MSKKRKRRLVALGLGAALIISLSVYFGPLVHREAYSFESKTVYSLPLGENEEASIRRVIVSDLTGDGRNDILISYDVASYDQQEVEGDITTVLSFKEARMVILSANTTGDFQKSWEYGSGLTRQTVAVGDFDGDGKLDLVVGGFKTENEEDRTSIYSRVEVLLQEENGSFDNILSTDIPQFVLGSLTVGEFIHNGRTSFVVGGCPSGNSSPYQVYLFRNEGGGNFTMSPIAFSKGIAVEDMWEADINSDGYPDLVIDAHDLDSKTYPIMLLLNDGHSGFEWQEPGVLAGVPFIDPLVIQDFTGDNYPDIMYAKSDANGSEVYLVRNMGGKLAGAEPVGIQTEGWIVGMVSAGFNNDNALDVLILESRVEFREERYETNIVGHAILIKKSPEGGLSFTQKWSYEFLEDGDISPKYAVAATDVDDDGSTDLILVSLRGEVRLALNSPI